MHETYDAYITMLSYVSIPMEWNLDTPSYSIPLKKMFSTIVSRVMWRGSELKNVSCDVIPG